LQLTNHLADFYQGQGLAFLLQHLCPRTLQLVWQPGTNSSSSNSY
jgi:hypothetical protein